MTRADVQRLLALAAMWGGSFIFIRICVPYFGPVLTAWGRVFIACFVLLGYAAATRAKLELKERWRQ